MRGPGDGGIDLNQSGGAPGLIRPRFGQIMPAVIGEWSILAAGLLYLGALFAVATYGDRMALKWNVRTNWIILDYSGQRVSNVSNVVQFHDVVLVCLLYAYLLNCQ